MRIADLYYKFRGEKSRTLILVDCGAETLDCIKLLLPYTDVIKMSPDDILAMIDWFINVAPIIAKQDEPVFESKRNKEVIKQLNTGNFCYLMNCGEYYKIGISNNPPRRKETFSTIMPYEVTLLHSFPCDDARTAETKLHEICKQYSHRGEWFSLPDNYIYWICKIDHYENGIFYALENKNEQL